jgi:predicted dinucleotide-binding enzyme
MSDLKYRGEQVELDDGRVVVVPKLPVGVQRDNIDKIKAAEDAAKGLAGRAPDDASVYGAALDMHTRRAEVVLLALRLNHPDITLEDLLATCSDDTITELYVAIWKRRGGQAKGEAASP